MRPPLALLLLLTACGGGSDAPDSGGGVADTTDAGPVCVVLPDAPCDLLRQDCAAARGCYLEPDAGALCAPSGASGPGTACAFQNQCAPGLACLERGEGPRCSRLCARDERCPEVSCRARCPESFGLLPDVPGGGFCTDERSEGPCDLLRGDCPRGTICTYTAGGASCREPAGDRARGASCAFANACAKGLACVNGACRRVCDTSSPQCPEGGSCVDLPGAEPAGVCL